MKTLMIALLSLSGLAAVLFTAFTFIFRRGPKADPAADREYPFVSLLKPVKGVDDDVTANLESFYRLDYPAYEILFAVDDMRDPCVPIIRKLQVENPHVRTAVVATGRPAFENPKVHKLACLESRSRGGLLWATDSNVRVAPDDLRRLVDEYLAHDSKVVFSPIRGSSSRTFASLMENSSLNFFTSGSILACWSLARRPVLVGKSILIERAALETFGGFGYFKDYLAEDFLIGEAFGKSGFRVATNGTWVTNVCRTATPRSFAGRMTRWAKLRFHLLPPAYVLEILLNPIPGVLAGWMAFGRRGWIVAAAAATVRIGLEYANFLFVNVEDRRRVANHLMFPAAVLARDFLFLAVYFAPFFSREVEWRGGRVSIGRRTQIRVPANTESLVYEGA